MKKNIFLFLFVFTALFSVYQYVSSKKYFAEIDKKNTHSQEILQDSIRQLLIKKSELQYFDLGQSGYGLDYFYDKGIENPMEYITTQLLETNTKGNSHPLIGYQPLNKKFQINKIQILNHRWIVCDFSDGIYWGEVLLRYDIDEQKNVTFTVMDELLYPKGID
ncbi:MAG: hydrolase [Capnocytophaga sp.]|nr:hydrolase [Capnocytophaga sp.]